MNLILIIIPIVILIIGIGGYFIVFSNETAEIIEIKQIPKSENSQTLIQTNVKSLFKVMAYENDFEIINGEKIWRDVFYELDESNTMIYDDLRNDKKTAVVFPIFTAAAYSEPGFYTFYRGECDREFHGVLFRDDDCLTVKLEDEYNPIFTSSANGLQVLNLLDYDIITDISIHQNPEILSTYEKIILLHNEYVTSIEFDAILSHPNVIYLYPNALYAEVNFDEELWEISLVRGHNYPEITIRNGFDWKFDNSIEEYDVTCEDMKFSKIDNGWMLNCYPENVLHKSKELLKQIKEF
ncbi:hypothetical protein OAI67_00645 [Candidatus Nitrosopelagicus sp.]|nr:hypothetical protein [Candidatus Nitrosopelagicus sp.]